MRKFLALCLFAAATTVAVAQDKKDDPPKKAKPETTLKVGDKAPELKADKWLQGTEVKEFAKDKIYIVEFWATWCGPCIVMMPHMGEMQAEYKDKGVTFIGYTKKDPNNSAEKVETFVKKRGPALGYTFAYSDAADTYNAWMRAAGQNGIPCCFVVDKAGTVAYIGHPMFLDVVLPKVVAGTWKIEDGAAELKAVEAEVDAVFGSFRGDAEKGLKTLADFEKKHPGLSKIPYFVGPKLSMMLKAKKFDDVCTAANELLARGTKSGDDSLLGQVSAALRSPDAKGQKALSELSVKAAEGALKLAGDKDLRALLGLAQAYNAAGDKAKAKEFGAKAVEAADGPVKAQVERIVKGFDDDK